MSLASLKKPARTVERAHTAKIESIDTESFIYDAVVYANGGTVADCNNVVVFNARQPEKPTSTPLKRATFTLGEEAIGQLNEISKQTKTSKSKLLRIMIAQHSQSFVGKR